MIYALTVPTGIEDVEDVRVLEWAKQIGDEFGKGDLLVELETHKALVEIRAGRPAVLRKILCGAGSWQAVGKPLAILSDDTTESLPDSAFDLPGLAVDFEVS
jgi:pyruvate/2-oxoglutarate dehydrogenase complex dihydrolipoamide acyltransferase (E2) component